MYSKVKIKAITAHKLSDVVFTNNWNTKTDCISHSLSYYKV